MPFLEKGSTGAVVPVATPAEVIASLSIFSFGPAARSPTETIDAALAIAGQAALAIDNARLYQQQKEFADTMQRSLLPREQPDVAGLEVGEVYESSARVDVGGDVYDFLELDDGRLAVVLGDVTGHGVEATADMAMAKFVFRSLAREHPEPGDFLASRERRRRRRDRARQVHHDGLPRGRRRQRRGRRARAPAIRRRGSCCPDGSVRGLEASGLVLGIDARPGVRGGARRPAARRRARRLHRRRDRGAPRRRALRRRAARRAARRRIAASRRASSRVAVTESCRSFAGGELGDDVAVVVIRRTA